MNTAAENGHLDCLKYLHKTVGAKCTENAMYWSVVNGQLECLKYLNLLIK